MTHRKAVNVKRRTAIGICAILVSLLLAGCSEDDEGRYGKPPTASPTQRTGTPSPTGPVSDEQAILAQYRKFWTESLPKAFAAPAKDRRAILAETAMGQELETLLENMSIQDTAQQQGYGTNVPLKQSLESEAGISLVRGCLDSSGAGVLNRKTQKKVTRGPAQNPVLATLKKGDDGAWRVSFVKFTGATRCDD